MRGSRQFSACHNSDNTAEKALVSRRLPKEEIANIFLGDMAPQELADDVGGTRHMIVCSSTNCYIVHGVSGQGGFGVVVMAKNSQTSQEVAIKIMKKEKMATREMEMLEAVKILDPVRTNMVHYIETFQTWGRTCLVFERLDMNLNQFLEERRMRPLSLNKIRPMAYQLFSALNALKSIGIVHSDLHAANIMLVNQKEEPYRVKLIDFGLSFKTSEDLHHQLIQPLGYRAPEVTLGLPISEAIDMWGVGCLLLYLFSAHHPFDISCQYKSMKGIVDMLGLPEDYLLNRGRFTSHFFQRNYVCLKSQWRMKTKLEYFHITGIMPKKMMSPTHPLNKVVKLPLTMRRLSKYRDRREFLSLLRGLLAIDPKKRITPQSALSHPFLNMAHLMEDLSCPYYGAALDKMERLVN